MEIRPLRAVNILLLTARCGQVAIPLFWALLDNPSGNSPVSDRINLLEDVLTLLGSQRMGLLVADRQLVGADGVGYVVKRGIDVGRRLPCAHPIGLSGSAFWESALAWALGWLRLQITYFHPKLTIFR